MWLSPALICPSAFADKLCIEIQERRSQRCVLLIQAIEKVELVFIRQENCDHDLSIHKGSDLVGACTYNFMFDWNILLNTQKRRLEADTKILTVLEISKEWSWKPEQAMYTCYVCVHVCACM